MICRFLRIFTGCAGSPLSSGCGFSSHAEHASPDLDHKARNEKRNDAGGIIETGRKDRDDDPDHPHQHAVAVAGVHHTQGIVLIFDIYNILDRNCHQEEIGNGYGSSDQSSQNHTIIKLHGRFREDQIKDQEHGDQEQTPHTCSHRHCDGFFFHCAL